MHHRLPPELTATGAVRNPADHAVRDPVTDPITGSIAAPAGVPDKGLTRAQFLRLAGAGAAGLLLPVGARAQAGTQPAGATRQSPSAALAGSAPASPVVKMAQRPIPSTGELLPVIGCGTYVGFDVDAGSEQYQRLPAVVQTLFDSGGSVLDSSPMYGRAEAVTGALLADAGSRGKAFLATKVWTSGRAAGIAQMEQSMRRMRADRIDLMQIHNLLDWRTQIRTLRQWKEEGRIRYLGVTHYTSSAYAELEAVMKAERLDFIQINYSLDQREAEQRILPLAAQRGMAVLINTPFGGGGLLRRVRERPLPPWAAEIGASTWAQVLLKFVLGHPAATCAIPGTSRAEHMLQNAQAGAGTLPDQAFWKKHAASIVV